LEQTINLVSIDPRFDIEDVGADFNSRSYLSKIILSQPNYLFNYSNLGHQSYYVAEDKLDLMSKMYFDVYRLGEVQHDKKEIEPVLRNADMVSFDVSCIRQSDSPGTGHGIPNGLYGEEACQITRYAGMSDKLTSIGFYEMNPSYDRDKQSTNLVAQLVWYFLEGLSNRKGDFPAGDIKGYTKYYVSVEEQSDELIFYKSNKSERWWIDVPYPSSKKSRFDRHHLVPCTYNDYDYACNGNLPDRWWKSYQKLT
ncbi:MAG: arginase family protein, partial [Flavobacteriales bacterium]|nr:arginase family protein [Flavobacteriales bacterium]